MLLLTLVKTAELYIKSWLHHSQGHLESFAPQLQQWLVNARKLWTAVHGVNAYVENCAANTKHKHW